MAAEPCERPENSGYRHDCSGCGSSNLMVIKFEVYNMYNVYNSTSMRQLVLTTAARFRKAFFPAVYKHLCSPSAKTNLTDEFLLAMRSVPSSVVVVTTSDGNVKRGVTCSSFSSVSATPPIISFCMRKPSRMHNLLLMTKQFIVHVLSEKQVHHSVHFSKMISCNGEDQFNGIPHTISDSGCPLLPNCCAVLHCSVHDVHSIGDHHVWYGGVVSVSHSNETPLLYYARTYRSIGDQSFMQLFETAALAYEDWTHEAHLRMAWNYLTEHGREEGVPLIKEGIKKYNMKHSDKIKRGYHETVTCFFIHMICTALEKTGSTESFEDFLKLNQHLKDSQLLFTYYSRETINTKQAKERFIKPDLIPLP